MDSSQGNSSGYAEDGGTGTVITEQVKQGGQQALQQTQQAASQVAESAKTQATSYAEGQKQTATQGLKTVAQALHQTGGNLGDGQSPVVKYTNTAGDKVEEFARYLETTPVQDLVRDVEDFARRNSTLFLGGAFALGLAAARFIKASSSASTSGNSYGNSYSRRDGSGAYGGALTGAASSGSGTGYSSPSGYGSGSAFASTAPILDSSETVVVDEVEYPDATVFDAEGETTHGSSR